MPHSNSEKQLQEAADIRAALDALGIAYDALVPGDDPPDFVLRLGEASVPLEHTRLYLDDSGTSAQALARRWESLKERARAVGLPCQVALDFALHQGWPHIPPSRRHAPFIAALSALALSRNAPLSVSAPDLPPDLRPYLERLSFFPCALAGEVSGSPDACFLSVPSAHLVQECIQRKIERLEGRVIAAWLVVVLGAEPSQPFLGVGELESELTGIDLTATPFDRVYVVDLATRRGYVLQGRAWSRAV